MSGRILALMAAFLAGMSCLSSEASARFTLGSTLTASLGDPSPTMEQTAATTTHPAGRILIVHGLRDDVNELVNLSISEELPDLSIQTIGLEAFDTEHFTWPQVDTILATGVRGCRIALRNPLHHPVLCTLLTEAGFNSLAIETASPVPVAALVIDQPISRQASVASSVYPALSNFATFSRDRPWSDQRAGHTAIDNFPFNDAVPLSSQLSDALQFHDALIATAEESIYNASSLSTVLLTAYGYRKPVIGFSRAYVKAGALISCYSTPSQIMRQVARMLHRDSGFDGARPTIHYPYYFSIVDNPSVARSLELERALDIVAGITLTDADFAP